MNFFNCFFEKNTEVKRFIIISLLIGMGMITFIILSHSTFDYTRYMQQWQSIIMGNDPWKQYHANTLYGGNSYGPFYNLFAYPYSLYSKLPRLLFAISWFFVSFFLLLKYFQSNTIPQNIKYFFWFILMFSPVFIIFVAAYGVNDSIMAVLMGLGLYCYQKQQEVASGLMIGSAILIKFMPLFILPFLCLNQKKINWKFALTVVLLVFIVFLLIG